MNGFFHECAMYVTYMERCAVYEMLTFHIRMITLEFSMKFI